MSEYDGAEKGEIKADIQNMFRAGSTELPNKAAELAAVAQAMSSAIDEVNAQLSEMGSPAVTSDLLTIMSDCHAGTARAVDTLNDIGATVVAVAHDFVERDEFAADVYSNMNPDWKRDNVAVPTPAPLPDSVDTDGADGPPTSGPYLPSEVDNPGPSGPYFPSEVGEGRGN